MLRVVAAAALFGCAACQSASRYEWGEFEESVFQLTLGFEGMGQENVQQLILEGEAAIERARAEARLIPPGFHAQLGLLYGLEGRTDESVAAFESEKELYPEATVFVDGLLERMGASGTGGIE